jgi:cytidine deaminase
LSTTETHAIDWPALTAAASLARNHAHAPYSGYKVGAALLTASGRVFTGCNVENASYGLSICAERSAFVHMVAAGERDPVAIAIVTPGPSVPLGPACESPAVGTPCGMCRQTFAEFTMEMQIHLSVDGDAASSRITSLSALLPDAFRARPIANP